MVAKLFRKIYDGFKHWQALSKGIDNFHELGRRIELGEVWNEKKLDRTAAGGGIIKKSYVKNGGAADGNDGRGQENLRGTVGRVQGRQVGLGNNRGNSEGQRPQLQGAKGRLANDLLNEHQIKCFEGINPTIHVDEWQNASGDLQVFSNALNEARAANKHGYKEQLEKAYAEGAKRIILLITGAGWLRISVPGRYLCHHSKQQSHTQPWLSKKS